VVMNKNHTRDRCQISELDGVRLKKVAFCVDVEVSVPPPLPKDDEHSMKFITSAAPEVQTAEKGVPSDARRKDSNTPEDTQKRNIEENSETNSGNANSKSKPNGAEGIESTEEAGKETLPSVDSKATNFPATAPNSQPTPSPTGSNQVTSSQPKTDATASRPRRRPTTDVSRIYKRCCQLRETPMLPLIAEQLAGSAGKTSLDSLDLSNHPLQLCDALVLSDFLALAPVTKLDLENCGLTDEALRVILSGLLAVKQPIPKSKLTHRVKKDDLKRTVSGGSSESHRSRVIQEKDAPRCRGMVEWLSLRNNPRIGRDGWRYISLFLHMSRSLKALDVSMIQLPQVPKRPIPSTVFHLSDTTALFCRALSERLAGVGLQELALNRCDISTEQLRGIVEAVRKGGTKRLDLEGNNITDDGLIYLAQWVKDGSCEGLSLSSNDLQVCFSGLHVLDPFALTYSSRNT